jgi:carbonic anhydrase
LVQANGDDGDIARFQMKKLFHFESPRERYQCDAAIVWCFDNRFELGFRKFLKRIGEVYSDPIKIAGGAKSLASPNVESDRDFVVEQIRISMRLHGTKRVILMLHSDCGAYGGLAEGFGGDRRAEFVHHRAELIEATAALHKVFPDLEVNSYFVDFEGVWEPDLAGAQAGEVRGLEAGPEAPVAG